MALNVQLNPHFLYNTLNIINWMAIENNQKEISKMTMSLSNMLRYTANNDEELCSFQTDLEWLKNYIYIMENRFEGKFTSSYDIDQGLYFYKVPKLFLQPFVENAIVHAFEKLDSGGQLNIRGVLDANRAYFYIEDNGCGMDNKKVKEIMSSTSQSIGIKNVDKRIKLLYGEEYGVQIQSILEKGTKILIKLPLINKNSEPKQKN